MGEQGQMPVWLPKGISEEGLEVLKKRLGVSQDSEIRDGARDRWSSILAHGLRRAHREREDAGSRITQRAVADFLRITEKHYSDVMAGRATLSGHLLVLACHFLQVGEDEVVAWGVATLQRREMQALEEQRQRLREAQTAEALLEAMDSLDEGTQRLVRERLLAALSDEIRDVA